MKDSICICLDEELNKIVDDETGRNGFNLDEFINTKLKEKFNLSSRNKTCNFKFRSKDCTGLKCALKTMPSTQSSIPCWTYVDCDGEENCVICDTLVDSRGNTRIRVKGQTLPEV